MISWISNLIQKRSKAIFSVLLFIIIIAFVFTIGAGPGLVSRDKTNQQNYFYGIDLNSKSDLLKLRNATTVTRYMNGIQRYDQQQFSRQMMLRQVRLYLAERLAIPNPTSEQLKEFVKTKAAFRNESGQFDQTLLKRFAETIKDGGEIDDAFVTQVLKDDYRLEQLDSLMMGPGMVLEEEVMATALREKTSWSLEIAKLDYDTFAPALEITDEAIEEYFASRQFQYQIPAEYTISFVEFNASVVKDPIEDPGEEALQRYFLTNRAKFAEAEKALTPEQEEGEEEAVSLSPLEIYAQIKNEVYAKYVQEKRIEKAVVVANDFTVKLHSEEIKYNSIEFKKLLLEYGLKLKTLPPFTEQPETQLADIVPKELFLLSMHLDNERYYSDVVANRNNTGYLVAFLESKTSPRLPNLEEVKTQVANDYREMKKAEAFSEKGIELATNIREKLQQGEAFASVMEANDLTYEKPEPFTFYSKPESVPYQLLQSVEPLKPGEMSDMITIENTGYFVYVEDRVLPEVAQDDDSFTNTLNGLNNYAGMGRYQILLNEMISGKRNIDM